jgi:RNA-directed DNA polymerase
VRWHDRRERKFLEFSFTASPEVKRVIAPKALDRFKPRIREITLRAKGVSMETTMDELALHIAGLAQFFRILRTPEVLLGLTRWLRLRLRAALWRQWKTPPPSSGGSVGTQGSPTAWPAALRVD